jgi:two-component system CheB/CheR fusion protein
MNEELQSTNEELETINDELRKQSVELDQVNLFLESILGSLGSGVVVLTNNLSIRIWNREAEDLWGLRSDEVVGEHFLNLDIGLPVAELSADIRRTLAGAEEPISRVLQAVNRRGRRIECEVTLSPLTSDRSEIEGVIILMDRSEPAGG